MLKFHLPRNSWLHYGCYLVCSRPNVCTSPRLSGFGRIDEIKVLLDGSRREFTELERWQVIPNKLAVARWIAPSSNPFGLPENTTSWGVWTTSMPHITTYRIHNPEGKLLKFRFDVIENLTIQEHSIIFHDLLLDAWVDGSTKSLTLEDEDEVEFAKQQSSLSEKQIEIINKTKYFLTNETHTILQTVDDLITSAIKLRTKS